MELNQIITSSVERFQFEVCLCLCAIGHFHWQTCCWHHPAEWALLDVISADHKGKITEAGLWDDNVGTQIRSVKGELNDDDDDGDDVGILENHFLYH